MIAFVGSVFSPYYARARRRGAADPENHCALNVAIYAPGGKHWAMTERGRRHVSRTGEVFTIGASELRWEQGALLIDIDEVAVPVPRRLRGSIRVEPMTRIDEPFSLDEGLRHHWCPIAPYARVEVNMSAPAFAWLGEGYLDSNAGEGALELAFSNWTWSRARLPDRTVVLYEVTERTGLQRTIALEIDAAGRMEQAELPPPADLPGTAWGLPRSTRAMPGAPPRILRTLEDTPFYARSSLATDWRGKPAVAMHEVLSLERFRAPWVRMLLPFRMPRRR